MRPVVDAAKQSVRCGDSAWPFRLDVRQGCASIALADAQYRVRSLTWQEKVRMARFATLDEAFLQSSFLDCCVTGGDRAVEHTQILTALAAWMNSPDADTAGLPLDGAQLAKVTVDVCRSMNIGPAEIVELPAPMVESLWRSLDQAPQSEPSGRMPPAEQSFDTKIIVLPDALRPEVQFAATTSAAPVAPAQSDAQAPNAPSVLTGAARAPSSVGQHAAQSLQAFPGVAVNAPPEPERTPSPQPGPQEAGARRQQQPRFRASLRTDSQQGRAPRVTPTGADRRTLAALPKSSMAVATASRPVIADPDRDLPQRMGRSAPAVLLSPKPMPQAVTLSPRLSLRSEAPRLPHSVAARDERSALPDVASAVRPTPTESMIEPLLDELCQRLENAAADLGILEEV
jgi:hypothetical protein